MRTPRSTLLLAMTTAIFTAATVLAAPSAKPAPARPNPPKPMATPKTKATPIPLPVATPKPLPPAPPASPARPVPTPTPLPAPETKTWALLVGVSNYANPGISSLKYPALDATGIRDALVDPKVGNLAPDHVKLLTSEAATKAGIESAVEAFLKPGVKDGDKVVVFLAGHGVAKGVGLDAKSYFLPTDVRGVTTAALEASAVDLRALSNQIGDLPAAQFVMFVDTCRENPTPGRGAQGNVMSDVLSRSVAVVPRDGARAAAVTLFACSLGQRAFEDPTLGHGVFTYWILDGLRFARAAQPDGTVDMGILKTYVKSKVREWAKKTSETGDFEIEQTPEMVANAQQAVQLVKVRGTAPATPLEPDAPTIAISTVPPDAQVFINDRAAGTAPISEALPGAGEAKIRVQAAGYETAERSVRLLGGYEQQLTISLKPAARGVAAGATGGGGTPANDKANDFLTRGVDAEARQQWEVAAAGYNAALDADPKFVPAYERLSALQMRRGDHAGAVTTLLKMVAQTPPTAHAYSALARAYAAFARRHAGDENQDKSKKKKKPDVSSFRVPQTSDEAAALARRAADMALNLDANSAEANAALGFALIVGDEGGANKRDALATFGKAVFLDARDATNQYGLGYAIRFFAVQEKNETTRQAELKRALEPLNEAVKLRPEYYEAYRELGYCYHVLGDNDAALRAYNMANSCRGAASDEEEVAGVDVAISSLHQEAAQKTTGPQKAAHEQAAAGYMDDARETSRDPNLRRALGGLQMMGLSGRLTNSLPTDLRRLLGVIDNPVETVKDKIRDKIRLPGGIRF